MNTTIDIKDLPQEEFSPMILRSSTVKMDELIVPTNNMDEEDKTITEGVRAFSP